MKKNFLNIEEELKNVRKQISDLKERENALLTLNKTDSNEEDKVFCESCCLKEKESDTIEIDHEITEREFLDNKEIKKVKISRSKVVHLSSFGRSSVEEIELVCRGVDLYAGAFENCGKLKVVKGSENIRSIGYNAFFGTGIEELEIENCEGILRKAFEGSKLEKITLSNKLKDLDPQAFSGCCGRGLDIIFKGTPNEFFTLIKESFNSFDLDPINSIVCYDSEGDEVDILDDLYELKERINDIYVEIEDIASDAKNVAYNLVLAGLTIQEDSELNDILHDLVK